MRITPVENLCWTVSTIFIPTAIFFSTFLTCVWNPRCLSMVTPKYLQWSDFFTKVEPTVTVSESLRRLSFLREKVMNSVLLPFKFSLFRQKYSSSLYICTIYIYSPVYARSPSPSQRPAPTTIASRSPFPLGLCSCSTSLSKMGT